MSASPPLLPANKRKRDSAPAEELEIDVDAPEPPSKKALRLAKKKKDVASGRKASDSVEKQPETSDNYAENSQSPTEEAQAAENPAKPQKDKRSEYGVWIGNLPFSTDKLAIRTFLKDRGGLRETEITRVHMPKPSPQSNSGPAAKRAKPNNKGFAYVDFANADAQKKAIAMSETLLMGRALLIKDSQSFEGRPAASRANGDEKQESAKKGKAPNKRIFVGNLDFETDREELRQHFEQCGEVEQIFLATFEDSGKSKGYGWVTFADVESAQKAVRGYIELDKEDDEDVVKMKRFVNTFNGRRLRTEYAEDATTRYQKRFGKNKEEAQAEL